MANDFVSKTEYEALLRRVEELEQKQEAPGYSQFLGSGVDNLFDQVHGKFDTSKGSLRGIFKSGIFNENTIGTIGNINTILEGDLTLKPTAGLSIGNTGWVQITDGEGAARKQRMYLLTGEDALGVSGSATSNTADMCQFITENQSGTNGSSNQTFMYALRSPLWLDNATNDGSGNTVTAAASVINDTTKVWATNSLAGAMIIVYDSSLAVQTVRQIASNTGTVITIDGTWAATVGTGGYYLVLMPVYLGSAEYPWRRLSVGGDDVSPGGTGAQRKDIRLGYGTSSGADVISIFHGTGDPETVVTANIGSMFLRTDGGANTTLYIKEANTDATGWAAI